MCDGGSGGDDEDASLAGLPSRVPALDPAQERAARTFLDSSNGSLVLVQVQG